MTVDLKMALFNRIILPTGVFSMLGVTPYVIFLLKKYLFSITGGTAEIAPTGSLAESAGGHARNLVAAWRIDFNHKRPHSSLAGLTPRIVLTDRWKTKA